MTPMFKQYTEIKKNYLQAILFYRLGDFYEMFFEDAEIAAKELGLVLTSRTHKDGMKTPMCGVPFHSANSYIARLVKKGYDVAICEQTEEPAGGKGLMGRKVVRVITPGTITDENILDENANNYIMSVYFGKERGLALADITTGEFLAMGFDKADDRKIIDQIAKYSPKEIIVNSPEMDIEPIFGITPRIFSSRAFEYTIALSTLKEHFTAPEDMGITSPGAVSAAGALVEYLSQTQMTKPAHIINLKNVNTAVMALDISARNNLEITKNQRTKEKKGSLLWVLDKTKNPMGSRLIKKWLEEPLYNLKQINQRLDAVEEYVNNLSLQQDLTDCLKQIKDMERLSGKLAYKNAKQTDLHALKASFEALPVLIEEMQKLNSPLNKILSQMDSLEDLAKLIDEHIDQGDNLIKPNVNSELDKHREAKIKGVDWLLELEEKEKELTSIRNLKIKFSKVFGYCIEVSNSHKDKVPERYTRRQTLTNGERYITTELKEIEEKILFADEHIQKLEAALYDEIIQKISGEIPRIKKTAESVAIIDVLLSFALSAIENNYTKPMINEGGIIHITEGRHPVVEHLTPHPFIPNDTLLKEDELIYCITGPNMAGKSTYMRGVALISLMAQVGSFVPAKSAVLGLVDKIFTRIGASDDLATGQSTFMVEMKELSYILDNATENSLIILDEIGRGTSTYDGLSIAWSVLEYLAKKLKAKTLFATHYHELAQIESKVSHVKNYYMSIQEIDRQMVFLRKVLPGSIEKSYGIQVAELAGLPADIVSRAAEILDKRLF